MNAIDNNKQTALHWAAVRGSTAVADVLLQNGARVEATDVSGYRVNFFPFYLALSVESCFSITTYKLLFFVLFFHNYL